MYGCFIPDLQLHPFFLGIKIIHTPGPISEINTRWSVSHWRHSPPLLFVAQGLCKMHHFDLRRNPVQISKEVVSRPPTALSSSPDYYIRVFCNHKNEVTRNSGQTSAVSTKTSYQQPYFTQKEVPVRITSHRFTVMNSDYSWKEAGQIDPSFSRAESDYVVAAVSLGRPDDQQPLGTSSMKNTDERIASSTVSTSIPGSLANNGLSGGIGNDMPSGNISGNLASDSGQQVETSKEKLASGRRNLSTTKRAAQNRNAQKAFRQRRDKYVKELETTAAEVAELHKTIEELRQENLQLRDYTLALQSRLIELSPSVTLGNVSHPQSTEFSRL